MSSICRWFVQEQEGREQWKTECGHVIDKTEFLDDPFSMFDPHCPHCNKESREQCYWFRSERGTLVSECDPHGETTLEDIPEECPNCHLPIFFTGAVISNGPSIKEN